MGRPVNQSMLKIVFISLLSGVVASVLFSLVHNQLYARSFGVVQLDQVIASHMRDIAEAPISDERRQELGGQFASALDVAIGELRQQGVFLIVNQAVVTSEADYTDLVSDRIKELMSGN